MRSDNERISALHKRAAQLNKENIRRRSLAIGSISIVICLAALIALAFAMPGLSDTFIANIGPDNMTGSIFSQSPYLGFIIIGVIAFALGVMVTVFCFRLKKRMNDNDASPEDRL